ncbi:MAG: LacI family DNA-binding transcriptional regulator [Lachnospirales bacterium]
MEEKVKLKDIAEKLNISVATVSNALAGKKGVSAKMRETIVEKAEELGYTHPKAENNSATTERIGVLVANRYLDGNGTSFYWAMYQQVAYALSKKDNVCIVETIDREDDKLCKMPKLVQDKDITGLIIIGRLSYGLVEKILSKAHVPVILVDYYDDRYKCDAVMSNNYLGMYFMTKYLVEKGHRGVAFVGTVEASENILDRYFGYRKCIEEFDIVFRDEWLIEDRDIETHELKIDLPSHMPTAFVCSSDIVAGVLYDELQEKGYKVPEDISIVGYDNYLYGHSFFDEITTYDVDMRKMAKVTVDILLKKIKNGNDDFAIRFVDGEMVERKSVKDMETP